MNKRSFLPYLVVSTSLCVSLISAHAQSSEDDETKILGGLNTGRAVPVTESSKDIPQLFIRHEIKHQKSNHDVIVREVGAPVFEEKQAPVVASLVEEQATVIQQVTEPEEAKEFATFHLSAKCYPNGFSLLSWKHKGQSYTAWSNIDAELLATITAFETKESQFLFLHSIKKAESAELNELSQDSSNVLNTVPVYQSEQAKWKLITGDESNKEALTPIRALHKLYQKHELELTDALATREENQKKLSAYREQNLETKKSPVIHFWNGPSRALKNNK